ncbi:MAG: PA2169 family four-helix-bundle protein [Acidobacteriota bacterium]|nr:PA2169 family four-helix-bundle protein [Acidobacteriota bacterium]
MRALHDLIATCHDAAEGYGKAAKGLRNKELSDQLAQISGERERFAGENSEFIQQTGDRATMDEHEGGILHRGWVDLETRIRPKDQSELLRDCINGDQGTLKHYLHALEQDLNEGMRSTVERQRAAVEADLDFLQKTLELHKAQHA